MHVNLRITVCIVHKSHTNRSRYHTRFYAGYTILCSALVTLVLWQRWASLALIALPFARRGLDRACVSVGPLWACVGLDLESDRGTEPSRHNITVRCDCGELGASEVVVAEPPPVSREPSTSSVWVGVVLTIIIELGVGAVA